MKPPPPTLSAGRSAIRKAALLVSVSALTGCARVDRRLFITSEPPGALVHLNDVEVGITPLAVDFTWNGTYDVRLEKEGYDPLLTSKAVEARLAERPVIDLFAALIPVRRERYERWNFTLTPSSADPDAIVERASSMRSDLFEQTPPRPGRLPR